LKGSTKTECENCIFGACIFGDFFKRLSQFNVNTENSQNNIFSPENGVKNNSYKKRIVLSRDRNQRVAFPSKKFQQQKRRNFPHAMHVTKYFS